jgi:hypothetical protein
MQKISFDISPLRCFVLVLMVKLFRYCHVDLELHDMVTGNIFYRCLYCISDSIGVYIVYLILSVFILYI